MNPPYDFVRTLQQYSSHKHEIVNCVVDNAYRRVFRNPITNNLSLIEVTNAGNKEDPIIRLRVLRSSNKKTIDPWIIQKIQFMLGLDFDLNPVYQLMEKDSVTNSLKNAFYGLRILHTPTAYEAIVCGITEQQISVSVALKLRMRLVKAFSDKITYDGRTYFEFPTATRIAQSDLQYIRELGFSYQKAKAIKTISEMIASQQIDLDSLSFLPSEEIISELIKIKGIGNWTAKYALSKGFGDAQVYSMKDLALRRQMEKMYGDSEKLSPTDGEKILDRFCPFSGYVAFYFIAAYVSGMQNNQLPLISNI